MTRPEITYEQVVEVVKGPEKSPHNNDTRAPNLEAVQAGKVKNNLKRRPVDHPEAPTAQMIRDEL